MLANNMGNVNIGVSGLNGALKKSLFVNATQSDRSGKVLIKIVNRETTPHDITIDVRGTKAKSFEGREIVLSATDQNAGNSFDNPKNVSPVEKKLGKLKTKFNYKVRPNSFTVLRLKP